MGWKEGGGSGLDGGGSVEGGGVGGGVMSIRGTRPRRHISERQGDETPPAYQSEARGNLHLLLCTRLCLKHADLLRSIFFNSRSVRDKEMIERLSKASGADLVGW